MGRERERERERERDGAGGGGAGEMTTKKVFVKRTIFKLSKWHLDFAVMILKGMLPKSCNVYHFLHTIT